MKTLLDFVKVLRDAERSTKITLYMSKSTAGNDFDGYGKNYTLTNLNPVSIKGYVKTLTPEALVWKTYGLHEMGAIQVICEDKYYNLFTLSSRIVVDGIDYQVFIEGTGNKLLIQKQPGNLLRVILTRNG